ncbi:hypothetical protein [Alicyclobacillus fodiniaquatilis]|uniref:Uncharacterized protein n=1 Tax=Alicyclobacillus fodiniaquatilis TaxID=1661150 RepID=A0ABW4JJ12_9BACL
MKHEKSDTQITVSLDNAFNPYEDKTLTEMQPDAPFVDQREPFNDVIKHSDIIVGHQQNRTLSDFPRRIRPWVRVSAIMTLVFLAGGILWDIVRW